MVNRNIVAIGGGGFGRSLGKLEIEKYIVSLSNQVRPKVCFIPTASGDDKEYKLNFYRSFAALDCITSHLDFFSRTEDLEEKIFNQNIIYVGGGNTKTMLSVWREWGLDKILKKAYEKGIIMSGVSAGAICWFENGVTDSYAKELKVIKCLGFIKGLACPHFDEEKERKPYVKHLINKKYFNSCICIEGDSAVHIINEKINKTIDFGVNKKCFELFLENGKILKKDF